MANENVIVNIQKLSKTIKGKSILKPLTYRLERGKILALCGGNGAGKSTLIRLITGILKPTTGKVKVKTNHPLIKKGAQNNQIGYMPDNFTFQSSLTAQEIIRFYAQIKQIKSDRYKEVLNEVGLLSKQHIKVGTFSKGMAQRLLLAQSLLDEPSLLILDEPTNGLDPYWIDKFIQMLLKAKQKRQTIIFSTHDLHMAEKVADEVIFIHNGRVISQGPLKSYQNIGLYETYRKFYFKSIECHEV